VRSEPRYTRRAVLARATVAPAAPVLPARLLRAAAGLWFTRDPSTLGVTSGYPASDTLVVWTRLAPRPHEPGGGLPSTSVVPLTWNWRQASRARPIAVSLQRISSRASLGWGGKASGSTSGASRSTPQAADGDTRFRIGSISKQFTAVVIMQFAERDLLRLSDPVGRYVSGLGPVVSAVSLEHLLNHSSGIADFADDARLMAAWMKPHSIEAFFATFKDKPLRFVSGQRFEYCNSNYLLLNLVADKERRTGGSPSGARLRPRGHAP
jgi:hypothetical protein